MLPQGAKIAICDGRSVPSRIRCRQLGEPDEVVGRQRKGELPADTAKTAMAGLAQAGGGLGPAEDLLDAFANDLAAPVSGMTTLALPIDRAAAPIPVAEILAALRTALRMGEVRPTAQPTLNPKRVRRRPDPLIAVTHDLRSWFEADPAQTGSQLLLRLQTSDPDRYPDALLRTVQRRFRIWRSEIASPLVFGIPNQPLAATISGTYA